MNRHAKIAVLILAIFIVGMTLSGQSKMQVQEKLPTIFGIKKEKRQTIQRVRLL